MATWVWFLIGIFLGGYFGFFIATVLVINKFSKLEEKIKVFEEHNEHLMMKNLELSERINRMRMG